MIVRAHLSQHHAEQIFHWIIPPVSTEHTTPGITTGTDNAVRPPPIHHYTQPQTETIAWPGKRDMAITNMVLSHQLNCFTTDQPLSSGLPSATQHIRKAKIICCR